MRTDKRRAIDVIRPSSQRGIREGPGRTRNHSRRRARDGHGAPGCGPARKRHSRPLSALHRTSSRLCRRPRRASSTSRTTWPPTPTTRRRTRLRVIAAPMVRLRTCTSFLDNERWSVVPEIPTSSGCDSNLATPAGHTDPNDPGFSNSFDPNCTSFVGDASKPDSGVTLNASYAWDLYSGSKTAGSSTRSTSSSSTRELSQQPTSTRGTPLPTST